MKKFLLLLSLCCAQVLPAQSPVTASPGMGATLPSSACLGCPGEYWSNEMNVCVQDNNAATVILQQSGMCFQSTCYVSRFLEASSFGFAIPLSAAIDSIFVTTRIIGNAPAIVDSIVQLEPDQLTGPVGANLAQPGTWPTSLATRVYGAGNPLWGYPWTPALVNNAQFAVLLKAANTDNVQRSAGVDHVSVTIYYSLSTGSYSASASAGSLRVRGSGSGSPSFELSLAEPSRGTLRIVNAMGQCVRSEELGTLSAGTQIVQLPVEDLAAGVYSAVLETENGRRAVRFLKM